VKANVPQFTIVQPVQHTYRRPVFAVGKKDGYAFIDLPIKPFTDEAGALPNMGCSGMAGVVA
jgi:hypothetical protein